MRNANAMQEENKRQDWLQSERLLLEWNVKRQIKENEETGYYQLFEKSNNNNSKQLFGLFERHELLK